MGIPNKINPMTGGGDTLPRGYIAADFLESTGTQYIDTQMLGGGELEASFDCMGLDKGASTGGCVFGARLTANHSEAAAKANGFLISKSRKAFQFSYETTYIFVSSAQLNTFYKVHIKKGVLSVNDKVIYSVPPAEFNSGLNMYVLAYNNPNNIATGFFGGRLYNMKLHTLSAARDYITVLDKTGTPCLYDRVTKQPFYNAGTGAFIVGMTISQARYLCKLPIVASGTLTVSLPWEAQWDTGVQNSLSIAASRGWTITVQYRDPEVATTNMPISFVESNADSLIWFTAPTPATSAEIELDIQYTQTRSSYQAACGIAGHTANWVAVDGTRYMLYSAIEGTNVLERSVILYKWYATPDSTVEGQSSLSVQGTTTTSFARNTTEAAGIAMLNYDNGGWNPYYSFARVWSVRAKVGDWEVKGTPRLTTKGVPVMYDVASKTEYPPTKGNNFIAGFDTAIQARNLAYLPDVTAETDAAKKSLTVSLPWDAQWDAGVQSALQVATDRDWTITVQYREPEITTKNIPIGFLESTAGPYINTNYIPSNEDGLMTDFETIIGGDRILMGSRNDNATDTRFYAYRYSALATTNGYGWGSWNFHYDFSFVGRMTTTLNFLNSRVAKSAYNKFNLSPLSFSPEYPMFIFAANIGGVPSLMWGGRIWRAQISNKSVIAMDFIPTIDKEGVPCMRDRVTKQLFYNIGTGAFIAGFDTVEQARSLAHLPDVTAETDETKKSLTVSLPWEAQLVITGVPAALQIAADRGWTITVQYRDPEADNAYYNKYAACTTTAEVAAVNADYQNDLTADGEWIYPLPELVDGEQLFYEVKNLHIFNMTLPKLKKANQMFGFSGLIKISIIAPLLEDATTLIYSLPSLEEVYFELPVCTNYNYFMPGAGKARRVIGSFALCKTAAAAFNINRSLEEIDARFPALEGGTRLFDGCQLKKQFALDCLNSIPSYTSGTHNIMLGIHIDHQNDEEVLTAITNAESKGWTVTVQWNGTATAAAASVSTFGLRSPAIYAKLGTVERPDGTTENVLDWGHYVTNWEENGYQEFSSVEEAEEYFNINQTEEAL